MFQEFRAAVRKTALGVVACSGLLVLPSLASADDAADAKTFISNVHRQVVEVFVRGDNSASRRKIFANMVHDYLAVEALLPQVIGEYWANATNEERKNLSEAYKRYAANVYAEALDELFIKDFSITKVEAQGAGRFKVMTKVDRTYSPVGKNFAWNVIEDSTGQFRIVDVAEGGFSLAAIEKKEWDAVLKAGGVRGMLDKLGARLMEARAAAN